MQVNKKLIESRETDPEVLDLLKNPNFTEHPFVKKWFKGFEKALKEGEIEVGALRGQTVGDAANAGAGMQVAATLEIFNAVIRGFMRYMDDSFVRKYTTESVIFKIPKVEYKELVGNIGSAGPGQVPHTEKMIDYVTIDLSNPESEKGGKVTWTRALLEDVTFDVQAEMAEGLGHAIAVRMMKDIFDTLLAVPSYKEPYGGNITISSPITWQEFLSVVGAVDTGMMAWKIPISSGSDDPEPADIGMAVYAGANCIGWLMDYEITTKTTGSNGVYTLYVACPPSVAVTANTTITVKNSSNDTVCAGTSGTPEKLGFRTYGPADFVLVSPDIYWELLNIIQMTNVLYEGSTDPIKRGVIKLALGTTIVKQGLLPKGTIVALNSEKAVALVTRRALKIEPVLFPVYQEPIFEISPVIEVVRNDLSSL